MSLELVIGNRNYSSWSLRGWLLLAEADVDFEVTRVPLFTDGWIEAIGNHSPAGRVPVLHDGDLTVWDTAAMSEHLLERFGDKAVGWPADRAARATARSVSSEMHSGFLAIREELPQNLRRSTPLHRLSERCEAQVSRIKSIWRDCYNRHGGPFLFGDFSIADVMYAPVALRFVSYGVPLESAERSFVDAVCGLDSVKQWRTEALDEEERIDFIDELGPLDDAPISLG
jgi:glutathione S-transferase